MSNLVIEKINVVRRSKFSAVQERKIEVEQRIVAIDQATDELICSINHIKLQIDTAKARKNAEGVAIDEMWLSKAQHAKRMKARDHQLLKTERGELSKELRKIADHSCTTSLVKEFRKLVTEEIGEKRCSVLFEIARNNSGETAP